jgi:hypothetical protein
VHIVHLEPPGETVWAVVVGAVLATLGGFVATQLEGAMRRRERERSAALLFGEILSALETIITIAHQARQHGEPYGPFTLRLVRAARREIDTYERNRGSLYDLRKAEIRFRIHVLMVQVTLALEGVLDSTAEIDAAQRALGDLAPGHPRQAEAEQRLQALVNGRESAFDAMQAATGETKALVAALRPVARVNFEALKRLSGSPYANDGSPPAGPIS